MENDPDYLIVGAGIVGLTLARELARRKVGRITVIEKEAAIGKHASGRNSGVVHAGIYYAADSLKAKFCADGHRQMLAYAEEHRLPILKCGKVIVASKPENVATLETLMKRAAQNGVQAEKITLARLNELEPEARSFDHALWSPLTAVIDSRAVLQKLTEELAELGVDIIYNEEILHVDASAHLVRGRTRAWNYKFLFNCAGVYADQIAHKFGVGLRYRILPFKGLYWKATEDYTRKVQRLIYPAPDIRMPFLGVHITRTVDGKVLFGPTAIPAFGRENYSLLGGLDILDTPVIAWHLLKMLIHNPSNFRSYVREEMARYIPRNFFNETRSLVHELKRSDIGPFYKVGIRAQLMDLQKGQLEMDFIVEQGPDSLHVLNAISPAFTCSFAIAKHLADQVQS